MFLFCLYLFLFWKLLDIDGLWCYLLLKNSWNWHQVVWGTVANPCTVLLSPQHLLITTIVTNPEGSGVSPTRSNLSLVFVLHQCLILVNAMALCIRMCSVLYPWWIEANYYDMGLVCFVMHK